MCLKISLEGVQRSRGADCSIHELQQLQTLRSRVAYVARSACGWLTIAVTVGSCQQISAGHSLARYADRRCVVAAAVDEYGKLEFNALRGAGLAC